MRCFGFFVQDPHNSFILHRKGSLAALLPPPIPASPCSPTFPFFRLLPAPLRQSTCLPSRRAHPPCSLVIPPTCLSSHGRPCEVPHLTLWLQGLDCYYPQLLSLPPCVALGPKIHTLLFNSGVEMLLSIWFLDIAFVVSSTLHKKISHVFVIDWDVSADDLSCCYNKTNMLRYMNIWYCSKRWFLMLNRDVSSSLYFDVAVTSYWMLYLVDFLHVVTNRLRCYNKWFLMLHK
jgi:hypothetical protein